MFSRIAFLGVFLALSFSHVRADLPLGVEWMLDSLVARVQGKKYQPEYVLVVVESPGEAIQRRLRSFFERYGVSDDLAEHTVPAIVMQLMERFGDNAVHIQERDFFPFLFSLMHLPAGQYRALTDRILELEHQDVAPVEAFVGALFEQEGSIIHAEDANVLLQQTRSGEGIIHAYWRFYFKFCGLNALQSEQALKRMMRLVCQGVDVYYAFQNALYYVCYVRDGLTPDVAIWAADRYVASIERFGHASSRYFAIMYEAYGFPSTIARTAADVLSVLFREHAAVSNTARFWQALYYVLGVSEENLTVAYDAFWDRRSEGLTAMRAFEYGYLEVFGEGVNTDHFFENLDEDLHYRSYPFLRLESFLCLLWEELFPLAPANYRESALRAFIEQPSSLWGIWASLSTENQVKSCLGALPQ